MLFMNQLGLYLKSLIFAQWFEFCVGGQTKGQK